MSVELRPPRKDDAAAITAAIAAFSRAYGIDAPTESDIAAWFDDPGIDHERDVRVALAGDALVGYGDASDAGRDGSVVYLDVRVDPAHAEAEPLLFDFLDRRAHELANPGGLVKAWAPERAERLRELIEMRGFGFDRYSFRMGIDLGGEPPEPAWPEGISVRTFRRDRDTEAVYEAHQEAFAEERDFTRDPFEDWTHWSFRDPFDPELWFLAEDDGEVAGISLCRPTHGADADCGWINILGVRKPWRRRGLGLALLRHSLRELRARGKRRAGLGVNADNPEAVRLYEGAGMTRERVSIWFRREV